jgi:hypothetical protein
MNTCVARGIYGLCGRFAGHQDHRGRTARHRAAAERPNKSQAIETGTQVFCKYNLRIDHGASLQCALLLNHAVNLLATHGSDLIAQQSYGRGRIF